MTPHLKRPADPMALAKLVGDIATGQVVDGREISTLEALKALTRHTQARAQWMLKAITLMRMVNEPEVDQARLREKCDEHVLAMPELR